MNENMNLTYISFSSSFIICLVKTGKKIVVNIIKQKIKALKQKNALQADCNASFKVGEEKC